MAARATLQLVSSSELRLTLAADGREKLDVSLGASDIEALIANLAKARARMKPEVPKVRPLAPRTLVSPLTAVVDVPGVPGKTLLFRHAGLGWLGFAFSQVDAGKIASRLKTPAKKPVKRTLQ